MHITNLISQYFGKFAKKEFPSFFQKFINNTYVKIFKIDMSEFRNAKYYKSLTDLFTRELAIPREINEEENSFISPSDSFITQCGSLHKETLFQYHRYHAPIDCEIKKLIHVPGKLYPVNLKYLNKELDLFVQNERVILECFSNNKIFYMVFVGALNVGQMVFDFEPSVETNSNTKDIKVIKYDDLKVKKGQTLGYFKMGSTVVMVWEKDSVELEELLNQKVKYGQKIGILK
jgi:phosphatidylserine decarboxylase